MANRIFWAAIELVFITSCAAIPTATEPNIDLTRYFKFSASSTCGDPPISFEHPINSGQLESCFGSDHTEELALDGNSSTRWQSQIGETTVNITFSLKEVSKGGGAGSNI